MMEGIYKLRRCDGLRWHDIPSFIKIDSTIQNLMMGIHRGPLVVFQNKENKLKRYKKLFYMFCADEISSCNGRIWNEDV
jgi:hypothetical protein